MTSGLCNQRQNHNLIPNDRPSNQMSQEPTSFSEDVNLKMSLGTIAKYIQSLNVKLSYAKTT